MPDPAPESALPERPTAFAVADLTPAARASLRRCLDGSGRVPVLASIPDSPAVALVFFGGRALLGLFALRSANPLVVIAGAIIIAQSLAILWLHMRHRRTGLPAGEYLLATHVLWIGMTRISMHPLDPAGQAQVGQFPAGDYQVIVMRADGKPARFPCATRAAVDACLSLLRLGSAALKGDAELASALDPLSEVTAVPDEPVAEP